VLVLVPQVALKQQCSGEHQILELVVFLQLTAAVRRSTCMQGQCEGDVRLTSTSRARNLLAVCCAQGTTLEMHSTKMASLCRQGFRASVSVSAEEDAPWKKIGARNNS